MSHVKKCILAFLILRILFPGVAGAGSDDWQVWRDCDLVEDEYYDGDSFYVRRSPRSIYIIRLYFVDCPETSDRFPDRVREQAEYFGIEMDEALKCGELAKDFTEEVLDDGFTVYTRLQKSYSASSKPRYYGFVVYEKDKFLSEELMRNGLARIHGEPSDRPDGMSSGAIFGKLGRLKEEAIARKKGAWKYNPDIEKEPKYKLMEPDSRAGQVVTLAKSLRIYTRERPHKFRGLLRSGAKLELGDNLDNQYIAVSFETGGKTLKAACRRWDID